MFIASALLTSCLTAIATAQFPPPREGITTLKSKFHQDVTISFKEVGTYAPKKRELRIFADAHQPGICETTPGVKSYSGYVHLPPGFLDDGGGEVQNYPINTLV